MIGKKSVSNNRKTAQKEAAKKRPQTWKPGQSGNPTGAPKRGESWAELIKRVGEYTPGEAAQQSLELAKRLLDIGDGVTLKEAVVMRVYAAMLFEPDARLWSQMMDRAEGKVPQPNVSMTWQEYLKQQGHDPATIFEQLVQHAAAALQRDDARGNAGGDDKPNA